MSTVFASSQKVIFIQENSRKGSQIWRVTIFSFVYVHWKMDLKLNKRH